MPLDFTVSDAPLRARRAARGLASYHAGLAAEQAVAADYARRGHAVLARRWRGTVGEVDLVLANGDGVIFVEVKHAARHDWAAERVSDAQVQRIFDTGTEFVETLPRGQFTDVRYDLALVDALGRVAVTENAFAWA